MFLGEKEDTSGTAPLEPIPPERKRKKKKDKKKKERGGQEEMAPILEPEPEMFDEPNVVYSTDADSAPPADVWGGVDVELTQGKAPLLCCVLLCSCRRCVCARRRLVSGRGSVILDRRIFDPTYEMQRGPSYYGARKERSDYDVPGLERRVGEAGMTEGGGDRAEGRRGAA
eukprot:7025233-Pyramimonas_sp.AAC.1